VDHSLEATTLKFAGALLVAALAPGAYAQDFFALEFDGVNDRVMVPYDPSFPTEVFTLTAWIRTPGAVSRKSIVARGEDSITGNAAWNLYMQTDGTLQLRIEDINDVDFAYASGVHIADDTWHHVVATRNMAGTVALYVDGLLGASYSSTGLPSSANQQFLTIGCTHGTFGPPGPTNPVRPLWFFPGRMDEVSIWNVALSTVQVQDVFTGGVDAGAPGLVGFWRMDECSGQVVWDDSLAGNDGYLGQSPVADSADPDRVTESPIIVTYCVAQPNSTGTTASIGVTGSLSIVANVFTLTAQGATPNQFALFFYGPEQTQMPLGDGFLCIGPGATGLFRLGPAQLIDGTGRLTRAVDFEAAPANAGSGEVLPGSTWNFQMWHRDSMAAGGTGSNLTDAVSVTFCH
jgi:hypothetical protein